MDSFLVVDDSIESIMVVQKIMKRAFPKARVIMATSGDEAIKMVENTKSKIALAFFDYNLENANGLTLMARMKRYLPINRMILYTADDSEDIMKQTKNMGAAYMRKPLTEDALKAVVEGLTQD
jgi:CheY-like chemotaxis protein